MNDIYSKAEIMSNRVYQMYHDKPKYAPEDAFEMFSYNNPVSYFWEGFILELYKKGFNDSQVKGLLQSKHMRWMFDADSCMVRELGSKMAKRFNVSDVEE